MIEISETKNGKCNLLIDGRLEVETNVTKLKFVNNEYLFQISTKNKDVANILLNYKIEHYPNFSELLLTNYFELIRERHLISYKMVAYEQRKLEFSYFPNMLNWQYGYGLAEFTNNIEDYLKQNSPFHNTFEFYDSLQQGGYDPFFRISFTLERSDLPIGIEIQNYLKFLELCYTNAINKINSRLLIFSFSIPDELKIPCEQYLLYFAQFLQDLGINATSNLKEEAGKVLFSVTPINDKEALDKIREALAVYLNLPASPIVYDDSFAAMRLQQQIENLQHSQRMAVRELQFNEKLLVAQSDTIREKNITISQQQSAIEQQNKIIEKISSKSIMMDSVENKEEIEKFCEGFEVGKSEFLMKQLGLHLNPATVLKNIGKKIIGKTEDKKSVLGLDEEEEN